MNGAAGAGGSSVRYLPNIDADFSPSDADLDYARRFRNIGQVVDLCEHSERVALLVSTLRNQWMVVNAAFVDLREVLGADGLPDPAARAFFELRRGEAAAAAKLARSSLAFTGEIRSKLTVWDQRQALHEELKDAIAHHPDALVRPEMQHWLERQYTGPPPPGPSAFGRYIALNLEAIPRCEEPLALVRKLEKSLSQALRLLLHVALLTSDDPSAQQQSFLTNDEPAEESEPAPDTPRETVWEQMRALLLASGDALKCEFKEVDGTVVVTRTGVAGASVPAELPDRQALGALSGGLLDIGEKMIDDAREKLEQSFRPNVAQAPMPAPFLIDLTPIETGGAGRVRPFKVQFADGRHDTVPDVGRIALLKSGMPESAYSHTNPRLYSYDRDAQEGALKAKEIALEGLQVAKDQGASFLALPEAFVPRNAVEALTERARELDLGLIAGLEYPEGLGGPVNEAVIVVPGLHEPVYQRKQGPSKYEIRQSHFETDLHLKIFRRTAIGTFAVVVCSDMLELDLLWSLAADEERLDLLVICARNPLPDVFDRLALADAVRLHAHVAVVNAWPSEREGILSSGAGTFIARPSEAQPLLDLQSHPLNANWEEKIEPPSVLIGDLPTAEVRLRDSEASRGPGLLRAPEFTRPKPE